MSWNHRVIKRVHNGETFFQIHEVYYDSNGKPNALTAEGIAPLGETLEVLQKELELMLKACSKPILNYEDF